MRMQRKQVPTNKCEALDEQGHSVLVEELTELYRAQYEDDSFGKWNVGDRRFFVNHTKVAWEAGSDTTLISPTGARYTVTRWGQRTDPLTLV